MLDFHVTFRDFLHAVNLRHGTDGFTSPTKEGVLRIFSPCKIQRFLSGLNPRTWVTKASTLPVVHRSRLMSRWRELQNKSASRNSITPQSADSRKVIVRVIARDKQAESASTRPSTNRVNASGNSACHDSTSVVSQTVDSGICTNVNVTSEVQSRSVDLSELTLVSFTDISKQVQLHFIRDPVLYFRLRQTPDLLKLPLTFRAVKQPTEKQWFSST